MYREFSGKRVLVTGGAGFVGSNLVNNLLAAEPKEIIVVDNLLSSERFNVPTSPEVTFTEGSIADDGVLAGLPDDLAFVFHLATYHGNQSSIHDPLADHDNNLLPTIKLFDKIKTSRTIQKVVYASAGCTVAEKTFEAAAATTEDDPVSLWLDSPYQISKIVGELYSNYYFSHHKLPVVKARFQNVYGRGEILGAGQWRGTPATVWRNVIPTFVYRAIKQRPLTVENGGITTRDFIYVDDIVEGLTVCATAGAQGETYNLASGVEVSILDLANLINRLTHNPTPFEPLPGREWDHSGRRFGSTKKAKRDLGFQARVGLEDGLSRTISWTRKNLPLIEKSMSKHASHLELPGLSA